MLQGEFGEAIRTLLLFAPILILSLSFHEYAHAWSANRLGDATARYLGRLTIDPMAHISWVGTVIFPAIAVLTGAPLFGWANPVPVDTRNFKQPRTGMALVAAAGPASNILIAIFLTATLAALTHYFSQGAMSLKQSGGMLGAGIEMILMAIQLNLFLAFFNLIPIPPLDGSRILQGLVSPQAALTIDRFESYGGILLLVLVLTGVLRVVAYPVFLLMGLLFEVFQVSL